MPQVVIRLAESAVVDLEDIKRWYIQQGVPELGVRFVKEMFARIDVLVEHPDIGRVIPEFKQLSLRELIHPPFRIVYRRGPGHIRIVRVWRSERLLKLKND